jgi:hypothetical protein
VNFKKINATTHAQFNNCNEITVCLTVNGVPISEVAVTLWKIKKYKYPNILQVRSRVWSSGICGGQSGAGAGFLRVLRFPLPIFILPNSSSS